MAGAPAYTPAAGAGAVYPGPAPTQGTDGVSVAALITGILGMGIIPIVLGILGLRRTGPGKQGGRGMAIAGLILGAIGVIVWIVVIAVLVWGIGQASSIYTDTQETLHTECEAGDLAACDTLYLVAPSGSEYEQFGRTCGDRGGSAGMCSTYTLDSDGDLVAPEPAVEDPGSSSADTYGDDPELDALWDACAAGDNQACDDLYMDSPFGSEYEEFGDTCGGRSDGSTFCS